jgi:hypothetical protein
MAHMKRVIYDLYRRLKVRLNYWLDRGIEFCDMVLMDAYRLPWPAGQSAMKRVARWVGNVGWLLRDFPRLSVHKLVGPDWTIVFVGRDVGLREVSCLFFQEEVIPHELGRVALWELSARTQQWIVEGADLVVCELGCVNPWSPRAALKFTTPTWIQQVLAIPESTETLIAGKKFATERHRLNKAQRTGFDYRFSQSRADFDHFHQHMYLPYVKARHGHLSLTASRHHQKRWFDRGGLVLVTQDDKPVAGLLCHMCNGTFFDLERGVLEADCRLFKQGIGTMITWHAMNWAHDQGAKLYDMGGSHAWTSNGSFTSKRRWGARVVSRRRIYGEWTFLLQDLPPSLQAYLNDLGFIGEIGGAFYRVWLSNGSDSIAEDDLKAQLLSANEYGLDGLLVVSFNSPPAVYDATT